MTIIVIYAILALLLAVAFFYVLMKRKKYVELYESFEKYISKDNLIESSKINASIKSLCSLYSLFFRINENVKKQRAQFSKIEAHNKESIISLIGKLKSAYEKQDIVLCTDCIQQLSANHNTQYFKPLYAEYKSLIQQIDELKKKNNRISLKIMKLKSKELELDKKLNIIKSIEKERNSDPIIYYDWCEFEELSLQIKQNVFNITNDFKAKLSDFEENVTSYKLDKAKILNQECNLLLEKHYFLLSVARNGHYLYLTNSYNALINKRKDFLSECSKISGLSPDEQLKFINTTETWKQSVESAIIDNWDIYENAKNLVSQNCRNKTIHLKGLITKLRNAIDKDNLTFADNYLSQIESLLQQCQFLNDSDETIELKSLMKNLVDKHNIENERKRKEELQRKAKETKEFLLSSCRAIEYQIANVNIDQARAGLKKLEDKVPHLHNTINSFQQRIEKLEQQYKNNGISIDQPSNLMVDYVGKWFSKNPLEWTHFPGIFYPNFGTCVFPYRRHKNKRRGYLEEMFQNKLAQHLENFHILGDVSIHLANDSRPYEPDIAIVGIDDYKSIRIDVEIDEPYSGVERKPIHFIGCGDESRDLNLVSAGWIVVRFAEIDIKQNVY